MSDHRERACTHCGSLLHHEYDCPDRAPVDLFQEAQEQPTATPPPATTEPGTPRVYEIIERRERMNLAPWAELENAATQLERDLHAANRELAEARAEGERLREERALIESHRTTKLDSDSPVASCDCLTKSPDIQYHKRGCKYRLIMQRAEAVKALEEARAEIARLKATDVLNINQRAKQKELMSTDIEIIPKCPDCRETPECSDDGTRWVCINTRCRRVFIGVIKAYFPNPMSDQDIFEAREKMES